MLTLLAIKWLGTALVVILVSLTATRAGPHLGGVLAGTPMVFAPGYFFMLQEQSAANVAQAALASLHSLMATLAFCLVYVLVAGRRGLLCSLAMAVGAWLPVAAVASQLPGGVPFAIGLFVVGLYLARRAVQRSDIGPVAGRRPGSYRELWVRGSLAGIMVCLATSLAKGLDPTVAGVVLGFPVAMLTIIWTLHQRFGVTVARATMAAAMPGMLGLVVFCALLVLSVTRFPPLFSFSLALTSSLSTSVALLLLRQRRAVASP